VFENRVLKRISGSKREEVAGGWRRLHNEGFHEFFSSPNIRVMKLKNMRCSTHGREKMYKILSLKPEGNRAL
jgi:hypothetical protein